MKARTRLPLALLLAVAAPPAALAQALSPTQFLPGDATAGPAAGNQRAPAIARGGDQYLAVWQDDRTDLVANQLPDEGANDIYAARLDASGNVVDQAPIPIIQAAGEQTGPKVAWNGSSWLVAWSGQIPLGFYYSMAIQAARVSPQGVLLDPTPLTVGLPPDGSNYPELFGVASDGTNWLVAWKVWTGSAWAIQGRRITPQGTLLDANPVTLHGTFQLQPFNGDVVFATDEYLVVWQEWRSATEDDVFGRRVNAALAPIGGAFPIRATTDDDVQPSIATDGNNFFVVCERESNLVGGEAKIYGTRVSHAGQVLDPSGILISATTPYTSSHLPAVCWDGARWIASWSHDPVVGAQPRAFACRISASGTVLDPGGFPVSTASSFQWQSAIADAVGGGAHVLWHDNRSSPSLPYASLPFDIYAAHVPPGGSPGPDFCISLACPSQISPSIACNGNGYLVVFESAVAGAQRILGQRLDSFGIALDLEPFEIQGSAPALHNPAVAWNGSVWLAAWEDTLQAKIFGRRIGPAGNLLDAASILVMSGITPDVAAVGGDFLVAGTHTPSDPHFRFPYAARVRGSDGAVLDPVPIPLGAYFAQKPKVAASGTRWVVAWQRNFSHDDIHANIHAAFVETNGTISGNFLVAGPYTMSLNSAAVASDGNAALVAWSTNLYSGNIQARPLLASGSMLATFDVSTAPEDQSRPAVGWSGAEFVAAWQDLRNIALFWDERTDLYGARVDSGGTVLDPSAFAIANGPTPEIHPAVAGFGGSAAIAGATFRSTPFAGYRIGIRVLNPPPCSGTVLAFGSGCPGTGGLTPSYSVQGCPSPEAGLSFVVGSALPGSIGILGFGLSQASVPLGGGCLLLITPVLPFFPVVPIAGTGSGTFSFHVPPGTSGTVVTTQGFVIDPGGVLGFSNSNGIQVMIQ